MLGRPLPIHLVGFRICVPCNDQRHESAQVAPRRVAFLSPRSPCQLVCRPQSRVNAGGRVPEGMPHRSPAWLRLGRMCAEDRSILSDALLTGRAECVRQRRARAHERTSKGLSGSPAAPAFTHCPLSTQYPAQRQRPTCAACLQHCLLRTGYQDVAGVSWIPAQSPTGFQGLWAGRTCWWRSGTFFSPPYGREPGAPVYQLCY